MKLKVGDTASWVSQSAGKRERKKGSVRAIVYAGDNVRMVLRRLKIDVPRNRVRAETDISPYDRYLVEVAAERGGAPVTLYHVPRIKTVDEQAETAAQAQAVAL